MPSRNKQPKEPRKTPLQARSKRTRHFLLAGATRVLKREGASRFTTNRVADAAGVSVGSLYQYYPNKAALLGDLHAEEAERTWAALEALLHDSSLPPRARFERIVLGAFAVQESATEHHEALRGAGVAPRATPEMADLERRVSLTLAAFLARELPQHDGEASARAAFCVEVVFAMLERVASRPRADIPQLARGLSSMLADYAGFSR